MDLPIKNCDFPELCKRLPEDIYIYISCVTLPTTCCGWKSPNHQLIDGLSHYSKGFNHHFGGAGFRWPIHSITIHKLDVYVFTFERPPKNVGYGYFHYGKTSEGFVSTRPRLGMYSNYTVKMFIFYIHKLHKQVLYITYTRTHVNI